MDAEPGPIRCRLAVLLLFLFPVLGSAHTMIDDALEERVDYVMSFVEDEVRERLAALDQNLVEHRYDATVRNIIKRYLRYPHYAGVLIGRATIYFPLFEQYLEEAGLPLALKYLPIVESALRPKAISRVGAEGLWQFMPETALEAGLRIDEWVDERLDPHMATQAAIEYLTDSYEYFGDWSLALASYNAGKGGVRRAQRRSRGRGTFWGIKRNLPRETRNYVPGFIAATYLAEFYRLHEVEPKLPSLDLQLTERLTIREPLSFYRIAQITELPIDMISRLNPGYLRGYLPADQGEHYLTLPSRVAPAMRAYLKQFAGQVESIAPPWAPIFQLEQDQPEDALNYCEATYSCAATDSLSGIAQQLNIPVSLLAIWNQRSPLDSLIEGNVIRYFEHQRWLELPERDAVERPNELPLAGESLPDLFQELSLPSTMQQQLRYYVSRREKPSAIASRYPHLSLQDLLETNALRHDRPLAVGTELRIDRQ